MMKQKFLKKVKKSSWNNLVSASSVTPPVNYANDLGLIPQIQLNW